MCFSMCLLYELSIVRTSQEFLKLGALELVGICTCKDAVMEWICTVHISHFPLFGSGFNLE